MQTVKQIYDGSEHDIAEVLDEKTIIYLDTIEMILNLCAVNQFFHLSRSKQKLLLSLNSKSKAQATILSEMVSNSLKDVPLTEDQLEALLPFFDRFITLLQDELEILGDMSENFALLQAINSTLQDITGNPDFTVHDITAFCSENGKMKAMLLNSLQTVLVMFMLCLLCDPLVASLFRLKNRSFSCGYLICMTFDRLDLDCIWYQSVHLAAETILNILEDAETAEEAKDRAVQILQSSDTLGQMSFLDDFGNCFSAAKESKKDCDRSDPERFAA